MKVCSSLICLLFLTALQDANAESSVLTEEEGRSITHGCQFFSSPFGKKTKIFCRGECEEDDVLIRTTADTAQDGRYSIKYNRAFLFSLLNVSITNLTKSDSGRYRCGVHNILNSNEDFVIRVKDAPVASTPNWTPGALSPSVPSAPSASSLTTAQSLSSSSGSSAPPSASPEASEQPEQQQTSAEGPGVLLYVGLTLLVMVGALSAAVLIACRKSARKPKDPPVESERMNGIEPSRVYEEIQEENRRSGPPPGEISTLYSQATFPKLNAAEATDEYSLVTAATSQTTPEDDSSKLTYSQLDFAASSLSSAPCGDAESVVYSAPRLQDASPPLYSTVTSHPLQLQRCRRREV